MLTITIVVLISLNVLAEVYVLLITKLVSYIVDTLSGALFVLVNLTVKSFQLSNVFLKLAQSMICLDGVTAGTAASVKMSFMSKATSQWCDKQLTNLLPLNTIFRLFFDKTNAFKNICYVIDASLLLYFKVIRSLLRINE